MTSAVLGGIKADRNVFERGRGKRGSGTGFGGRAVWVEPGVLEGIGFWSSELFDGKCELEELLMAQDRRPTDQPVGHGSLDDWSGAWVRRSTDLLERLVDSGGLAVWTGGDGSVWSFWPWAVGSSAILAGRTEKLAAVGTDSNGWWSIYLRRYSGILVAGLMVNATENKGGRK